MSRQQTRPSGDGAIDPSHVQKKRARHRLVGAICLCLIAAVVVPLVLESEPKPQRSVPMELAASAGKSEARPAANAASAGGSATGGAAATGTESTGDAGAPASSRSAVKTVTPPAVPLPEAPGAGAAAPAVAVPPAVAAPPTVALSERAVPGSRTESGPSPAAGRTDSASATAGGKIEPKTGARPEVKAAPRGALDRSHTERSLVKSADTTPERSAEKAPEKVPDKAWDKAPDKAPDKASDKAPDRVTERASDKTTGKVPPKAQEKVAVRAEEPDLLAKLIDRANRQGAGVDAQEESAKAARRFLVQIGAFSNVQSARSVSDRAVQAGLRPYQETVKTAQGDWIRVRVGPFQTRQDAERAQQDLKRAGVTAAIIAL